MADDTRDVKPEAVDSALGDMKLEEGGSPLENGFADDGAYEQAPTPGSSKKSRSSTPAMGNSRTQSPMKKQSATPSPNPDDEQEVIGGDITVTVEDGKPPKLSRKAPKKVIARPAQLYDHLPDSTEEAVSLFSIIKDCIYGGKYMGHSEHDSMDCDCAEQWSDGKNHACGEDSDCINRATKMECVDNDCNCGNACQNQRFQRKQYADVSVFKTEKKGYGLRANHDLASQDFIFEYLGEVINERLYKRRVISYADEGIKHFYFMSLSKSEFVDATKKGNLGRFCNHSCNPNCYIDKWVVGDKLRMGIFASRDIKAGEELVFNYNVDRYGSDPQPCYCGEPNCTGFLGGKTQTERATQLPQDTIEALGLDDSDGWDTAVAKKPRKQKTGEDDEEYVSQVQPKGLDEDGVRKIMATLMQCKERWIVVKLLSRIQRCDDDRVRNKVVQMHGYQILRASLTTWKDDNNVVLQILEILYSFPRITRNKITKAKIEGTVQTFTDSEHIDVAFEAKRLLEVWGELKEEYRISRKKADPNAVKLYERRNTERVEEVTRSPATPAIAAPKGPRHNIPQRTVPQRPFMPQSRPAAIRRQYNDVNDPNHPSHDSHPLPEGWYQAKDDKGNAYYYSKTGLTTWQKPYLPVSGIPPPPKVAKHILEKMARDDLIKNIVAEKPKSNTPSHSVPTAESTPKEKKKPVEKWRTYPLDKQMKLYENTLFPHIKHVMQKYSKQLPKDDLKKFAKEAGKKLVASDYKNNRVADPTKTIGEKQEKKVKKYVREFFDKAVEKKKAIDKKKREKSLANGSSQNQAPATNGTKTVEEAAPSPDAPSPEPGPEDEVEFSDHESLSPSIPPGTPVTGSSSDLKRKRDEGEGDMTPIDADSKRLKEQSEDIEAPTPPPPPPPPTDGLEPDLEDEVEVEMEESNMLDAPPPPPPSNGVPEPETEEQRSLRRQEEDLMRENEEALMDIDPSTINNNAFNDNAGSEEPLMDLDTSTNTNGSFSDTETPNASFNGHGHPEPELVQ
ncbi:H3 lysine-36 specific histone-lysine N-methyltransferase [Lachnellula suecica]|uniref:Histone-lysine N-methyltransferase, H3 lysine-36 specific n=1 Tax=Lachnellula suecica TaxID=602035 RepID=A0A8T9C4P4_9HELO|nr:H3 lysine-36 specific histone-lysine N-methyltransferase [Lachnellula suecica]